MKISLMLVSVLFPLGLCQASPVQLHVNGPDGKPVAGAQVRVLESKGSWFERDFYPAHNFVSDAGGNIAFESQSALSVSTKDYIKPTAWARVLVPQLGVSIIRLIPGANTIALAKGQTVEGVVLDSRQKPVANARLVLDSVGDARNTYNTLPDMFGIETRTDAQGHWKLDSMPLVGEVHFFVQDARFKSATFVLDLSQPAPPFFLEHGTTVKGRLLRPDGKPATGVKIMADDYMHPVSTDANGRFLATGIKGSNVYLQALRSENLPFLVADKRVEGLDIGEVRDIGDWKTTKGIRVTGRLVSSQTKKPIVNAPISVWGKSMIICHGKSDKNGAFALTVAPDSDILSIQTPGHIDFSRRGFSPPENGVIDFGTLLLQSGFQASGTVVDETGAPVKRATLYAEKNLFRSYAFSDEKTGTFKFDTLTAGDYTVKVEGLKVLSGAKFTAGTDSKTPLRVVVQGKASTIGQENWKSRVRVVDTNGDPVAGAILDIRYLKSANMNLVQSTNSQSDGTFKDTVNFAGGPVTASIYRVYRPGYLWVQDQDKVKAEDGTLDITVTLQKRGSILKGHVVDTQGHPIPEAFVGLQNGDDAPIKVDAAGAFTLDDVPASAVTLLASNGPSFASFSVEKDGQEINIVLPDTPQISNRNDMAESLLAEAKIDWNWKSLWRDLGTKRFQPLILKGVNGWTWSQYIDSLAHREPRTFLESENELRAATQSANLSLFEHLLMLSQASEGTEEQKSQVRAWLSAQEKEQRDISVQSVQKILEAAEIAARLDSKQGGVWLEYALQINDQLGAQSAGGSSEAWGRLAARISPTAPLQLSEHWSTTGQVQLLASAMQTWREDGNASAARGIWEKIGELALDLKQHPVPRVRGGDFAEQPDELLNQMRGDYARLLATTNPKAALAAALSMQPPQEFDYSVYSKQEVLLSVARAAAQQKQLEVARAALDEVNAIKASRSENLAAAAQIAQQFDKEFAATLWSRAYAKARPLLLEGERAVNASLTPYAKARAVLWPGESRILLEREWTQRLQNLQKPHPEEEENQLSYDQSMLGEITVTMASLSPARTTEMLGSVSDKQNLRARTRSTIAAALLQPVKN